MGHRMVKFFTNMGSKFSIIPPEFHHPRMGNLIQSDTSLRSWGSRDKLDVRGMFTTKQVTAKEPPRLPRRTWQLATTQRQFKG